MMVAKRKISLVLADVDGTLVNEEKVLTERAQSAVRQLRRAGIRFAITSGRPPLGMAMLFDPLELDTPIAGFNGGLFVKRDLTIVAQKTVPADVAREAWTVKFEPKVVANFDGMLDQVAKIVGVSDDHDRVRHCEADAQAAFGQHATAARSQPYYLDITNKEANKG